MPLSDHEQRLLDQMEQALYAEDPKFASHMVGDEHARTRRRLIIGALVLVAGLGLVILGVMSQLVWLGGIGFAVMVAGGGYALTPGHKRTLGSVGEDGNVTLHQAKGSPSKVTKLTDRARKPQASKSSGSFMERMEQRWDKRRGQDGW